MKKVMVVALLMAVILPSSALGGDEPVVYSDSVMSSRLDRVGAMVTLGVEKLYPQWQGRLRFRVADDNDLNAYAYADGRIFITKQAMEVLPDDELASVLNHEATHVVQKHGQNQAKKGLIWRVGTLLLGRALGAKQDKADTYSQVATGLATGGYSRKDEDRADAGSVDLCVAEGVDPLAPARLLARLQKTYGNGSAKTPVIGWFAGHPDTGSRVAKVTERAKKFASTSSSDGFGQVAAVQAAPTRLLGGVAVIVRDSAGGGYNWGGYGSSEQAIKTTMEDALAKTGRFTIVDQQGRDDAWQEQDLPLDRMDPETMPQKGKTHGAKWFLYITLNYSQVTEEQNVNIGNWSSRADVHRVKAEIRGKCKFEPVERSIIAYTTDFRGAESGLVVNASTSNWRRGIDVNWQSRPEGQAVESACRKVVTDLVSYVESQVVETAVATPPAIVQSQPQIPPNPEKVTAFTLHIAPLPSEGKVAEVTTILNASSEAVRTADYVLLMFKDHVGQNVIVAKINFKQVRGAEIWGAIEYPYLTQLDLQKVQFVRLMKLD